MEQPQKNRQPPRTQYKHSDGRTPNPQHLAIALHHANQIQARKDAEALILNRILELIDFPTSPSADAAAPSAADAAELKAALVPFQPSDFDSLIQERNIEGRCGYALCPREHRKEDPNAKFRIIWGPKGSGGHGRGREMKIVSKEQLEMWCSDACAERALYLRIQLAEEPVWERRPGAAKHFTLLEEARAQRKTKKAVKSDTEERQRVATTSTAPKDDAVGKLEALTLKATSDAESLKQLAVERGDSKSAFQQNGRLDIQILEKKPDGDSAKVTAPTPRPDDQTGGSIEGYVPYTGDYRYTPGAKKQDDGNDDVLDSL